MAGTVQTNGSKSSTAGCVYAGIILVHGGPNCEGQAARLLSWYDLNARIAPHEEPCPCANAAGRPDPGCPRCHGSGRCLVMDNPDGKFASARRVAVWPEWSVRALADFAGERCRAIVTPDGEWHDRGPLSADEWRVRAYDLLTDHAHFTAVVYEFTSPDRH